MSSKTSEKVEYQCWMAPDKSTITIAPANNIDNVKDPDDLYQYSIFASSWEEAMTEHHKRQGWEPYKSME